MTSLPRRTGERRRPRGAGIGICVVLGIALFGAGKSGALDLQLAQNWQDLSPKQRYDAMQNYLQHEQLPKDRQRDIENRYERFRNMPPDEQNRIRQNYQRLQQLPPQERERFDKKYEKWKRQATPGS